MNFIPFLRARTYYKIYYSFRFTSFFTKLLINLFILTLTLLLRKSDFKTSNHLHNLHNKLCVCNCNVSKDRQMTCKNSVIMNKILCGVFKHVSYVNFRVIIFSAPLFIPTLTVNINSFLFLYAMCALVVFYPSHKLIFFISL